VIDLSEHDRPMRTVISGPVDQSAGRRVIEGEGEAEAVEVEQREPE
jgi:hypothetical protein